MKKTIRDIDVHNKRVIVRCDFNVPIKNGTITDDTRIAASVPTIKYLLDKGAKVLLISHLGRPNGKADPEFSLFPVAEYLEKKFDRKVIFESVPQVIDRNLKKKADKMKSGDILLFENIRFRKEEEENDPVFSKELASYGDIFVNDAFGTAHRAHASTVGITDYIPAVSGFLMESELKFLGEAIENPDRPFVAVLGGAKVKDKIKVIDRLMEKADVVIIGGGMAYTFIKARGFDIGTSIVDEESLDLATEIEKSAKNNDVELILPVDIIAADIFDNDARTITCGVDNIPKDMMGLDIGPETSKLFSEKIKVAGTVFWNGPMGVFEMPNFAAGTKAVAKAMADSNALTIIGGGDSAAAVNEFGMSANMTHISTGGGASLRFIEGVTLPGIDALDDV